MSRNGRPFVVGLSGPTGAGKSTMGRALEERCNAFLVQEPDPSALLAQMLDRSSVTACDIQEWIVRERSRRISDVLKRATANDVVIVDRMLWEDRDVFFQLHHRIGLITNDELANLERLIDLLENGKLAPDATMFFWADKETLVRRLQERPEGRWLQEHLDLQITLYDKYRLKILDLGIPLVAIDTSEVTQVKIEEKLQLFWSQIIEIRSA
jgi:deoxyadenosine/deoxycytidine kinase